MAKTDVDRTLFGRLLLLPSSYKSSVSNPSASSRCHSTSEIGWPCGDYRRHPLLLYLIYRLVKLYSGMMQATEDWEGDDVAGGTT
jgi:hypothetical protein